LTAIDAEAPRIIASQSPVYHITGLDCCLDYEIKVQVDSVDFGLSAWSDSIMIHTPELSESAQSEVEQLKKTMEANQAAIEDDFAAIQNTIDDLKVDLSDLESNIGDVDTSIANVNLTLSTEIGVLQNECVTESVFNSAKDVLETDIGDLNSTCVRSSTFESKTTELEDRVEKNEETGAVWFVREKTSEWRGNGWHRLIYRGTTAGGLINYPTYGIKFDDGRFIVQIAGTYEFQFQGQAVKGNLKARIRVQIGSNVNDVSYIADGDSNNSGPVFLTTVIDLNPGNKVWVEVEGKLNDASHQRGSIFSGKLIKAT